MARRKDGPVQLDGMLDRGTDEYLGDLGRSGDEIAAFVYQGRLLMDVLSRRAHIPHCWRFDLQIMLGEALSNAYKFATERRVGYLLRAHWDYATIMLAYATPVFDPNPPVIEPDPLVVQYLPETGRGLLLMRELSSAICFRQPEGGLILAMELRWDEGAAAKAA